MVYTHKVLMMVMAVVLGAGALAWAQEPTAPAATNVSFSGPGGVTLKGYLAVPAGGGRAPAVVLIHEWWGLNNDMARLADALASEGYVVLAADAFRGSVASDAAAARKQTTETPAERIAADLDAALDYLRSHPRVDADRVASLGFCFGGTQAMRMGTRRPDLAAVVIFYGGGPIQDAAGLGSMKGPVLGIYGEQDQGIPVPQVRAFESALDARSIPNVFTVYPGVGHAFVKSTTYRDGAAAERAWRQMVEFLANTLKK